MIRVKGIWMHWDVIDKKLIVGEHKIKDISMGARITSITSHMKILLQKKDANLLFCHDLTNLLPF